MKSVPFEAILTNERLILVNSRDTLMPPQYLPLAAVMSMDTGENAIRDPTITFSVATEVGSTRQMVLTFSRQSGGERRRECDEWVKVLRERLGSFSGLPIHTGAPAFEPVPAPQAPPVAQPAGLGSLTGKKRIEVARPMKKIIETVPAPQKPKETTSLPQGSFCSRCGSRVPPDSAFCNRCGTRVAGPLDQVTTPAPQQEPGVQQVPVPVPNIVTPIPGKERPIEDVIHSIEPLIEDSKPRTQPAPLVPSRHDTAVPPGAAADKATQAPAAPAETDPTKKNLDLFSNILIPSQPAAAEEAPGVAANAGAGSPAFPPEAAAPSFPERQFPVKKPRFLLYAVIAVVVIAIIAGGFLLMKNGGGETPEVTPTPTMATTAATPVQTTAAPTATAPPVTTSSAPTQAPTPPPAAVPQTGVWIHVSYGGSYTGSYGTPGYEKDVTDSGDHVYQVPTLTGIVVATFTKNDGSADPILVEVYKNGVVVASKKTSAPKGTDEIQVDLKAAAAPTPSATPTPTVPVLNGTSM
ncbi:MAG TPA: zinc-ribbon domain-containing protein [Methanoregula sp.]|nr:zinc-ribbon domain-containing protein [Methanoregula sp.]